MRDFSKGLRMIDLKIPVFVELPKLKTVSSDGTYSVTKEGDSAPCEYDVPSLNPSNQIEGQKQEYIDFHDTDNL